MTKCSFGRPLDVIACCFCDEEGLGAGAVFRRRRGWSRRLLRWGLGMLGEIEGAREKGREVPLLVRGLGFWMQPVMARPAVKMACGVGMYIVARVGGLFVEKLLYFCF